MLTAVLILVAVPAVAVAQDAPAAAPAQTAAPAAEQSTSAAAETPEPAGDGAQATASATSTVNATTEELQRRGGFLYGASLIHSVGQGTLEGFVDPGNAEMLTDVGAALRMSAIYGFEVGGVRLSSTAMGNLSMEYSLPDNAAARRFSWGDIRLGLSAPGVFTEKITGISLTPSVNLIVPISLASRWQNMITSTSVGVTAFRSFGSQVVATVSVSASRGWFAGPPGPSLNRAHDIVDQQQNQLFLCRTDDLHCVGGLQNLYSLSAIASVSYRPTEKLSLGIGFGLAKRVKPGLPTDDEFASTKLDQNGERVVAGQGETDLMSGSIEASYALTENFAVSFDMSTEQSPKTNDNKSFAFPFFAFGRQENSATSYSLSLSAQY
ncbi:MAG: hypothetical protein WBV82_17025 [Myxococcaceae bacterium]